MAFFIFRYLIKYKTLKMGNLLKYLNETKQLINEDLDEAKEDRRGQVVAYLTQNPGTTVAEIGRAVWGRDINTLGRDSTQVITIVRTISSALKSGVIGRDDSKKPHKYYARSASGKLIGAPENLGGSPVVRTPKTEPVLKTTTKTSKIAPEQYLDIFNREWNSRGQWQGGPKYFDLETGERGPRTDHGGEDGEGWMSPSEIQRHRAPYEKKWMPILKDFQKRLAKHGIQTGEPYVDYGEKGHIALQLSVK